MGSIDTISPYEGRGPSEWAAITQRLVDAHPLDRATIRDVCLHSWDVLWETRIGTGSTAIDLSALDVPATVVGYFFEKLVVAELARRYPGVWRGAQAKAEKDVVHVPDQSLSVEMKCSGQLGTRVYGNRSYGQRPQRAGRATKGKSGYYITVNFFRQTLMLLRFGWIDAQDWQPQRAPTGQMAGLDEAVYEHKLVVIPGEYRLKAPVRILPGVGVKAVEMLGEFGITTIADLAGYDGDLPDKLHRVRAAARDYRR